MEKEFIQIYKDFISGFIGGVAGTLIQHPFDLIKIRLQINQDYITLKNSKGRGYSIIKEILNKEGILGLYRGFTPNLIGGSLSWGLYFSFYNKIKKEFGDKSLINNKNYTYITSSLLASNLVLLFTNPIWVIKTRMCSTYLTDKNAYNGFLDGMKNLLRNEGIFGLYRGFLPGIIGSSHGAVQFLIYENLKDNKMKNNKKLNSKDFILFSCLSKIVASITTYPYQVVRSRLHNQIENNKSNQYNSFIKLSKNIYRNEGLSAYFKGVVPNTIKVLPATIATFLIYENLSKIF